MSAKPNQAFEHAFLFEKGSDDAVVAQLSREVQRLESQLERLKKHDRYLDGQSLRMYEDMLASRKAMLHSLS